MCRVAHKVDFWSSREFSVGLWRVLAMERSHSVLSMVFVSEVGPLDECKSLVHFRE